MKIDEVADYLDKIEDELNTLSRRAREASYAVDKANNELAAVWAHLDNLRVKLSKRLK